MKSSDNIFIVPIILILLFIGIVVLMGVDYNGKQYKTSGIVITKELRHSKSGEYRDMTICFNNNCIEYVPQSFEIPLYNKLKIGNKVTILYSKGRIFKHVYHIHAIIKYF
jgi:hypothetical protein